ncbi:putative Prolamin-like domain-containing protein [Arabidopsis thaliana]|uniref:At3g56610 n=3 Tax=Arabidopsis TaxID=3701 RepID=Q9LXX9_ARATH|nr:prolamin-like protein [Arabidopsis thaliana]KAG7628754.1 Prolamin-like domain [Arabidopsis thaliana x Arabidopsis arenosa]KAG7634658.1 Prolamin-like domain [Arabidopsis suecica]AAS76691.1 At3g56610 [Arabidopsis thaliana]AAS88758.1 At3g56610 [Arabidopsis thaliana]AEE79544.1 prolamin-like protein [Arabidopsis thaliana]|eukprot:NP_191220.1 prolamin-like protein [Arabidopsis thaliana]
MALKATMVTKSMFAALFTIIAMATLASAASGLAQSPESDHLVNKCMAKLSSRCAMYVTDAICTIHGPMRLKHHGCCLEVFHMGRACLKIVTNHVIQMFLPKFEGVRKQYSLEKSTYIMQLCVPVLTIS